MLLNILMSLDAPIYFGEFNPEEQAAGLRFSLNEGKYQVTLRTYEPLSNLPPDPHRKFGLAIEIEMADPHPDVIDALRSGHHNSALEDFYHEVYDTIVVIYRPFESYIRNTARQYWIEPMFPDRKVYYNAYLNSCCRSSSWLDSDGNWKALFLQPEVQWDEYTDAFGATHYSGSFPTVDDSDYPFGQDRDEATPIDQDMWHQIGNFIQEGKLAPMRDVLMANSLMHLENRNGRLAVVEAVIALEASIKQLIAPNVIARIRGASEIDETSLNSLIEKMGLRAFVRLGLSTIKGLIGLQDSDIKAVVDAIDARNLVVHSAKKEISINDARNYVLAIKRVIHKFENWTE